MKTIFKLMSVAAVAAAFAAVGCNKTDETAKSYDLTVEITLPEGVETVSYLTVDFTKSGKTTTVKSEERDIAEPVLKANLPQGDYKISVSAEATASSKAVGAAEVSLYDNKTVQIALELVYESPLLIKAVQYTPGKQAYIQPNSDTWIEIVNNSDEVQYLDQLILLGGMGRQTGPNAWQANGYDYLYGGGCQSPVIAFPGEGTDYPLQPGESVVVANCPINHPAQGEGFENCTDLSNADFQFYAEYNAKDTDYEGFPKMEIVAAFFPSQLNWGQNFFGWAGALIKLPAGVTPAEYAANEEAVMTTPGTASSSQYLVFPNWYVLDAVDCWDPTRENNYPTFLAVDDAEGILGPDAWSGQGVRRKVTKIENGRAYYKDTNKSSADFVVGKIVPGAVPTSVDAE